ncbi:MAG: FtsQ-type POTRA domain-containing protein [Candidatus Eremiobacteraeota bacterium]|nr:FtsQ-type POTRA domain-containing protein [Candidatus Eremiobacteraeota bacterium]
MVDIRKTPPGSMRGGPQEKPRKRGRTGQTARKVFLVLIFLAAQLLFLSSDFFKLKSIEVAGIERISGEDILKETQFPWGSQILIFDERPYHDRMARILWVKSVKIAKVLPGGVKIEVKERTPVAASAFTDEPEKWYAIDDDGVVLCVLEGDRKKDFPRMLINEKLVVGGRIDSGKVDTILKFYTWLTPEMNRQLIDLTIEENSQISFRYPLGKDVIEGKLDTLDNVKDKLDLFSKILAQMEGKAEQLEYIDLRYKEPVVKLRRPASPPDEKKEGE